MKHIRIIALSLALVLMLGLFAACGKSGSGSESGDLSQPDASVSLPEEDLSTPDTSTPDASQPEEETPAPEVKPEVKPEEKPQAKPQQKPEVKPEAPTPEVKPEEDETVMLPIPEAKPEEAPAAPAKVDLTAFYSTIFTDPENTPALVPMENDALDAFYPGLNALSLTQKVAYMPMMTAVPCEIVMVECANAADAETVRGIFNARITAQVDNHSNYPLVIEAWEKEAKVVSNGHFVALFVISGMTDQVAASFNALF